MIPTSLPFGEGWPAETVAAPRALVNIDPLISVIRNSLGDADLMRPLKSAVDCLDSGPFLNVCLVSLKSVPYAFYGDKAMVKEFDNGISCRLRYFEAALMGVASLVYNFVFATAFSVLSLVTLGQVQILKDQMRKLWIHTALAAASTAIGFVGTASPALGIKANLAGGMAIGVILFQWMESGVIRNICSVYQRHRTELQNAARQCVQGNAELYNRQIAPFFTYLDEHLNDRVQTLPEFLNVVQESRQHLNASLSASPGVVLENVMGLFNQLRSNQERRRQGPDAPVVVERIAS